MMRGGSLPPRQGRGPVLFLLLLALFTLPSGTVTAQEVQQPPPGQVEEPPVGPPLSLSARVFGALKREAKRYASDSVALVKAPLSWKKPDLERAAGIGLILGGLLLVDRDIDQAAQRNRSRFTDRVSGVTTALGGQYGFHVSGAMLAAGLVFNHENLRETGRDAIEAGLLAHVLDSYFFKRAFGRERPADSNGRNVFVPGSNHDSFPSGHATEAFAVASVVAARSKGWPIPVLAYTAATIVAMDRVNNRAHFASDVVAGAFLGTAVGHFLVHRHGEVKKGVLSKADLQVVPIRHGLAARIAM